MARWTLAVAIDAVSVSASLVGSVAIEAEESTSRIATFTIKPAAGAISPTDWIGSAVTIDYIDDPDGTPVVTRVFTGEVNLPTYNPVTGLVTFDCTDNLQGHFEAMDQASILSAIVGGKYAIPVFGEREDGWQQALDVLSTVAKSYDFDRNGSGVLTDWAAKVTPDYSYTGTSIIDESVSLELARLRDLVNRVSIEYQYRYTRLHHREHGFGWNWGNTFCLYFADSHELPNRDMVNSAVSSASWNLQGGITFETLPVSDTYNCGSPVVWIISDELRDQLVTNAAWTVVRRWSQTITETYQITVEDPGSVTLFGVSEEEDRAGDQSEYEDSSWDSSDDTSTPAWTVNAIGDYTEDQLTRSTSDNNLEVLLQVAATRILSSHRANTISARVLVNPFIERSHTISIDAGNVTGVGKVSQYNHSFDINTGSALTEIKIAVSRSSGGVIDALTAPTPPDTAPTHAAPSNSTVLVTRLGNDDTAPNYDANWTGFTGNYTVAKGTPAPEQIYPRRIRVVTPDIETESRDSVEFIVSGLTYDVNSPNETLTING